MDTIGLDLHKRESQLCILAEDGTVIERSASSPAVSGSPRCSAIGRERGFCSRRRRRASGSRSISRAWATRSSSPIRTMRRCTRRARAA